MEFCSQQPWFLFYKIGGFILKRGYKTSGGRSFNLKKRKEMQADGFGYFFTIGQKKGSVVSCAMARELKPGFKGG